MAVTSISSKAPTWVLSTLMTPAASPPILMGTHSSERASRSPSKATM